MIAEGVDALGERGIMEKGSTPGKEPPCRRQKRRAADP